VRALSSERTLTYRKSRILIGTDRQTSPLE
jgi:hypothetical protein